MPTQAHSNGPIKCIKKAIKDQQKGIKKAKSRQTFLPRPNPGSSRENQRKAEKQA
jgi:hypothetical protein